MSGLERGVVGALGCLVLTINHTCVEEGSMVRSDLLHFVRDFFSKACPDAAFVAR